MRNGLQKRLVGDQSTYMGVGFPGSFVQVQQGLWEYDLILIKKKMEAFNPCFTERSFYIDRNEDAVSNIFFAHLHNKYLFN